MRLRWKPSLTRWRRRAGAARMRRACWASATKLSSTRCAGSIWIRDERRARHLRCPWFARGSLHRGAIYCLIRAHRSRFGLPALGIAALGFGPNRVVPGDCSIHAGVGPVRGPEIDLLWFVLRGLATDRDSMSGGKRLPSKQVVPPSGRLWHSLWKGDCWFIAKGIVRLKSYMEVQGA